MFVSVAALILCAAARSARAADAFKWESVYDGPPGAWDRLLSLSSEYWLRVVTDFPAPNTSELKVYRSADGARTWTQISTISDGARLVDNGFLYSAPNGDLLLSGRNNVLGRSYQISQWRSTDGGHSWAREADIASASKGLWEPFYYTASGNRTVVLWADETKENFSQVLSQRVSSDSGRTWGAPAVIVSDGPTGRPGMPGATRMSNGAFVLVFEVCGTRNCDVYSKVSDDGVAWPSGIGARVPGQVCGPFVTSLTNGMAVLTSCRTSDTNYATPVSYSTDNAVTWTANAPAFTDAGQYGNWPALYQLNRTAVVAVSGSRIRIGAINRP